MTGRRGWRRTGSRRFRYLDSHGARITDDARLGRIAALAIPPSWRDVRIAPSPSARVQATGLDNAGRRQYLYHPEHRARQEQAKYDRLVRFGTRLPGLREQAEMHLACGPYGRDWACALGVILLNRTWFRVGTERYARSSRTFGMTTLRKSHVTVDGGHIRFRYRGKHRVVVRTTVVDEDLASAMSALLELDGGSRLFRFVEHDCEPASLTARMLNGYLADHLGDGLTSKDFRTWGGTLAAAVAFADHGPPRSDADARRVLAAVMRKVSAELGNTPAVARTSYVSPAVVAQWREGRTLADFDPRRLSGVDGLTPDERALLALLRSDRVRRGRTTA